MCTCIQNHNIEGMATAVPKTDSVYLIFKREFLNMLALELSHWEQKNPKGKKYYMHFFSISVNASKTQKITKQNKFIIALLIVS